MASCVGALYCKVQYKYGNSRVSFIVLGHLKIIRVPCVVALQGTGSIRTQVLGLERWNVSLTCILSTQYIHQHFAPPLPFTSPLDVHSILPNLGPPIYQPSVPMLTQRTFINWVYVVRIKVSAIAVNYMLKDLTYQNSLNWDRLVPALCSAILRFIAEFFLVSVFDDPTVSIKLYQITQDEESIACQYSSIRSSSPLPCWLNNN